MRAAFAPIVLNLLLAGAGVGVLAAMNLLQPTFGGILAALGLAFLAGASTVGMLLLAALAAGVPYTTTTIAFAAIFVGLGTGAASTRMHGNNGWTRRRSGRQSIRALVRQHYLLIIVTTVFAAYAIVGLLRAAVMPLSAWDAWAIWTQKALLLTDFHHLPARYFTDHAYLPTHQDYPLLVPLLESMWFRFAGKVNTQTIHVEFWLLLISFCWAAAFILARRGVPVLLWGPILLVFALAPGTSSQLLTAYADIPMALFAGLGILLLGLWISDSDTPYLALGVLFLAAAANTKNEGLAIAIIALTVAAVVVRPARSRRRLALGAAALVLAVLPWHLWSQVHGVPSDPDLPISKVLDFTYLLRRADRLWPSLSAIHIQLADQATWSYVVPIGAAVVLMCIFLHAGRRPAFFYLGTATLTLAVYLWVYWASPLNLKWYLATSDFRIIDVIVLTALAASLQLPAEAHRALTGTRPPHAPG